MALPEDQSNWPIDAPAETESFNDNMLVGGYNPDASVQGKKQRKFTLLQLRLFFSTVLVFLNGIRFNASRIAMQEKPEGFVSLNTGWHTVAVTNEEAAPSVFARVYGMEQSGIGSLGCELGSRSGGAIGAEVGYLKLTGPVFSNGAANLGINGYRIGALSGSSVTGYILQAYLETGKNYRFKLAENYARGELEGLKLVTPVFNNLLPDGSTADTFLEAGAEFKTTSSAINSPSVKFAKISNDIISLTINFNQIPKQATGLSLAYSNLQLFEYTTSLINYAFDGSETIGSPVITGNEVSTQITKVAAFTNFSNAGNTARTNSLVATLT